MRPLLALIAAAGALLLAGSAAAEPVAAAGYRLETVHVPGAAFAGLARDGGSLLVTELASGRLYRRGEDGRLQPFGPVFPHGPDVIGDPTGPYRVARVGAELIVAQGWTPASAEADPRDHSLVAIDAAGKTRIISNDFWNPFDFVAADQGFYVVDAARNSVEHVRSDGRKRTVVSFRRLPQAADTLQNLSPTEFAADSSYEVDAVPTGIALHERRLHVALFGGFPFLAGAGTVVSIPTGGAPEPRLEVDGLNAPVAIAFANDGGMFVLEHGTYDQKQGFAKGSGRLLKIDAATKSRSTILDGLTRPVSVLVWDARQLVVSDLAGNLYLLTLQ
ncbi:ScyD/ScyE family protein [Ensifer sp. BR816]|uniref:ScyD/ScyE family protein n=1 Tax=Rhizobium sp. (strain BR816) TaxID=1057002 RepID=UPI00036B00CA|nr:ScyD/ScyE family protein [Ensifer sp. BR816]